MSIDRVILFLHIPKTGGSTLEECLFVQCKNDDMCDDSRSLIKGVYYYPGGFLNEPLHGLSPSVRRVLGRPDLRVVQGHFPFGLHSFVAGSSTYVTLLRQPIERQSTPLPGRTGGGRGVL